MSFYVIQKNNNIKTLFEQMEKDLIKYVKEETDILTALIDQLKKGIKAGLGDRPTEGEITIKKDEVKAKTLEDLDYAVILSAFKPLNEPIMIIRVKYEYSDSDEFEVIGDDEQQPKSRPLEDYSSAGFLRKGMELGLEDPDLYYLNVKSWKEYEKNFKGIQVQKKCTFFSLEYRIVGHERFKIIYYHTEMFEDVIMRESQLFANRSIVGVGDLKQKFGLDIEDLKSSMSMTQIINKNFKLVEKMGSKIMEKDKQHIKEKFNKKGKAQEVDAQSGDAKDPSTVQIEQKVYQRIYDKMNEMSVIVYEEIESKGGNSEIPNPVRNTTTESIMISDLPEDVDELPEQNYEVSVVMEAEVIGHKKTKKIIDSAYENLMNDKTPFDNDMMNDSQRLAQQPAANNPYIQTAGEHFFESELVPELVIHKDHPLIK